MERFIAFLLGVLYASIMYKLHKRQDGRLVINDGDYYIAITTSPKDLEKRKWIHIKVEHEGGE